jgi:hypothetical protein
MHAAHVVGRDGALRLARAHADATHARLGRGAHVQHQVRLPAQALVDVVKERELGVVHVPVRVLQRREHVAARVRRPLKEQQALAAAMRYACGAGQVMVVEAGEDLEVEGHAPPAGVRVEERQPLAPLLHGLQEHAVAMVPLQRGEQRRLAAADVALDGDAHD